jgi:hypothetical protein
VNDAPAHAYVNWNLSRGYRRYRAADALVLSVGKSGRTWLRVMLGKYLALHAGVAFDLEAQAEGVPRVIYDHELWAWRRQSLRRRWLGYHICPDSLLRQKKVVLLYRDPRDVAVSLSFQRNKRSRHAKPVTLKALIRPPHDLVWQIVEVMNVWYRRLADHDATLWLGYEAMRRDPEAELSRVVAHLGLDPKPEAIREAVAFAAFDNMKKMEANGQFESRILRPGDSADPASFKVREGKVAGYRKHFDAEDMRLVERAVGGLASFFGYFPGQHTDPATQPAGEGGV